MKQKNLTFHVAGPAAEFPLVFAYSDAVEARSVVAKVFWHPEDPDNASKLNLSWSDSLKSHFTYIPRATSAGLKAGATIKVNGPGTIELEFLAWPSRKPITDDRICGAYIKTVEPSYGHALTSLQRIFEAGTTK